MHGGGDLGVAVEFAFAAVVEATVVRVRHELEIGAWIGMAPVAGDAIERDHARQGEVALRLLERVPLAGVIELDGGAERTCHLAQQVGSADEVRADEQLVASRRGQKVREAIAIDVAEQDLLAVHRGVEIAAGVDDQVTGGKAERDADREVEAAADAQVRALGDVIGRDSVPRNR